jgi:hypothetical protein
MTPWLLALVTVIALAWTTPAAAQEVNTWHNRGGTVQIARSWLEWKRNNVDGRYCLFSGQSALKPSNDVLCYDAATNVWEEIFVGNGSKTDPLIPAGGDLHGWGWDPVAKEYYVFDGKFRYQQFAFKYETRTWRPLTDADYPGIETHTRVTGAGTATSLDHNIMIIVEGAVNSSPSTRVRFVDLVNQTYSETNGAANPPARSNIQNQVLYIPPLRSFLLFGGNGVGGADRNDVWLYDLDRRLWVPIDTTNRPPGTANAHMAYDPQQNIVYLAGGNGITTPRVWILKLSNWTWEELPTPAGTPLVSYPTRRVHGASMFDPVAGFCLVGGVMDGATWQQSLQTWCFKHTVASDSVAPAPPTNVVGSSAPSGLVDLTVMWQASSSDPSDVDHYQVQRSQDGGNSWTGGVQVPANGSPSYSFTYQGVPGGPVRVRAIDAAGNASGFSP